MWVTDVGIAIHFSSKTRERGREREREREKLAEILLFRNLFGLLEKLLEFPGDHSHFFLIKNRVVPNWVQQCFPLIGPNLAHLPKNQLQALIHS